MSSVTGRIKEIKQPRGGYLKPSLFDVNKIDDKKSLNEVENIHASIIGMAVDYLTRFIMGADKKEAFKISCLGAKNANDEKKADSLLSKIIGLDEESIISACKLVTYDVWFRNPLMAFTAKGADEINPDLDTIENIKIMVERSVDFWNDYGPIVKDGFTFESDGYTDTVDAGDGDYITNDTIWDFKVSKSKPTNKHTLQLLMYWIMGQHSGQTVFKDISNIGIFNPRLNTVYTININKISKETIKEIEDNVICY